MYKSVERSFTFVTNATTYHEHSDLTSKGHEYSDMTSMGHEYSGMTSKGQEHSNMTSAHNSIGSK